MTNQNDTDATLGTTLNVNAMMAARRLTVDEAGLPDDSLGLTLAQWAEVRATVCRLADRPDPKAEGVELWFE